MRFAVGPRLLLLLSGVWFGSRFGLHRFLYLHLWGLVGGAGWRFTVHGLRRLYLLSLKSLWTVGLVHGLRLARAIFFFFRGSGLVHGLVYTAFFIFTFGVWLVVLVDGSRFMVCAAFIFFL